MRKDAVDDENKKQRLKAKESQQQQNQLEMGKLKQQTQSATHQFTLAGFVVILFKTVL